MADKSSFLLFRFSGRKSNLPCQVETHLKNRGQVPFYARAILETATVFWFTLFYSTTPHFQSVESTDSTGFLFPAQVSMGSELCGRLSACSSPQETTAWLCFTPQSRKALPLSLCLKAEVLSAMRFYTWALYHA